MFFVYFLFWIILNGKITVEICALGIIISAAVYVFSCNFLSHNSMKEKKVFSNAVKFIKYIYVLVLEIVKANFSVMHMILTEREEVQPVLVNFKSPMQTSAGKALLADAITLTPGTITVSLEDSEYVVHCLDESLAPGMDTSVFVDLLVEMEENQ